MKENRESPPHYHVSPLPEFGRKISNSMLVVEDRCLKAHGKYKVHCDVMSGIEI